MKTKFKLVSWRAKMTPRQVRAAIQLLQDDVPQYLVAQRMKVSQAAISQLARKRTYRRIWSQFKNAKERKAS